MKILSFRDTLNNGIAAFRKGEYSKAIKDLRSANTLNPANLRIYRILGNCLRITGRVEEAIAAYRQGQKICYNFNTHNRLINTLNYLDIPQETLIKEHISLGLNYCRRYHKYKKNQAFKVGTTGKIRIGYVSADFHSHPTSYFLLPVIENHSTEKFEIYCYYNGKQQDKVTGKFMAANVQWRKIANKKTKELYQLILADKIDILVDLSGHTSGHRLDVFCLKPAPLQVTYLGYPNSTGIENIDYRIVDPITDPEAVPTTWHSEKLFRLKPCFLCFQPPQEQVEIKTSIKETITFGTFNKLTKITNQQITSWVEILNALPETKFLIKSRGLEETATQKRLLQRFRNAGLKDLNRICLSKLVPSRSEHLQLYNQLQIALDTYPYNGATTTLQALWMGVPVITLPGKSHVSRVSSSILSAMDSKELIAADSKDYKNIAINLARDKKRLTAYKLSLRNKLLASPICKEKMFVKNLENAYLKMLTEKKLLGQTKRNFPEAACLYINQHAF